MHDIDGLKAKLDKLVDTPDGQISLMVTEGSFKYTYQTNTLFPAASLIKLGILLYVEMYQQDHPTILNEKLSIQKKVSGAGVLSLINIKELSVEDLLNLMISVSDNTATNVLIDYFGMDGINHWLHIHYPRAVLRRHMLEAISNGENLIDAETVHNMMYALIQSPHPCFRQIALNALHHQQFQYKLPAFVSDFKETVQVYNKTGELIGYDHDTVVFKKDQAFLFITVLSRYEASRQPNLNRIQEIGRVILDHFL